jgi:UDP-xylose/UDP-N-acetylglucosamine transporter B4
MASNICNHTIIASQSQLAKLPMVNVSTPIQYIYLVVNFLSHYLCISSVYVLTTECTSLTVTLVITLRKFASIIYSILYFEHPFTFYHWTGTGLIIVGTIIFTEIITKLKEIRKARGTDIDKFLLINKINKNQTVEKIPFYKNIFP